MTIAEAQVIDSNGNNVALNKPTRMSSNSNSENAVDGDLASGIGTVIEQGAWWEVDLEEDVAVEQVILHNFDISNAVVSLLDVRAGVNRVYELEAGSLLSTTIPIEDFSVGILARKVRVQLKGQNYLNLREVEVYDSGGNNVALNKLATQSSLWANDNPASKAVDGVVGTIAGNNYGNMSHTHNESGAWWEVDLGGGFVVKEVRIYNRDDVSMERLSDSVVILIDDSGDVNGFFEIGDASETDQFSALVDDFKIY